MLCKLILCMMATITEAQHNSIWYQQLALHGFQQINLIMSQVPVMLNELPLITLTCKKGVVSAKKDRNNVQGYLFSLRNLLILIVRK